MKLNCGEQEQESLYDLIIREQICDKSIHELLANYSQIDNYLLNTGPNRQVQVDVSKYTGPNRPIQIHGSKQMGPNRRVQIDWSKQTGPNRWVQIHGFKDTGPNKRVQIYRSKYTGPNRQVQINRSKQMCPNRHNSPNSSILVQYGFIWSKINQHIVQMGPAQSGFLVQLTKLHIYEAGTVMEVI